MKKVLKNIGSIQTGLFTKPVSDGDTIYLQSKHFDEFGNLNTVLHPDLKSDKLIEKHLLKHGDVLFAAKGTKNFAFCFQLNDLPAVASTSFFVIRIYEKFNHKVLPDFLAWSLNQPKTLNLLKDQAMGTSIVSISKTVLEDLEIAIPPIQIQKNILHISKLRDQEKVLTQQIEQLREKQIQQQIINAINL